MTIPSSSTKDSFAKITFPPLFVYILNTTWSLDISIEMTKNTLGTHMDMDAIFVDNCTSGWITLPLWSLSEQPPSTLACQFGWCVTLATSSKVLNMINLMAKPNGIISRSHFRKVKSLILAPFLVFAVFEALLLNVSLIIIDRCDGYKISVP